MNARPIRERVEGAPYQPGDAVQVVRVIDATTTRDNIGRRGRVEYLEYSCGSGQSYPTDPMIGVDLGAAGREEFWREELAAVLS